jgi:hypothetical protein
MTTEKAIKLLMKARGIETKTALALAADLSRPALDAVMSGGGSLSSARKIAAALGSTLDALCLDGADE